MEYGKVDSRSVVQLSSSGFEDMGFVDIGDSDSDEDISLSDLFGQDKLFRAVKSTDSSDGVLLVKTLNDFSAGYVPYPIRSYEKDLLLVPITHIKKTGSISGVIVFWQSIV